MYNIFIQTISEVRLILQKAEIVLLNRYQYSVLSPFSFSKNVSFKVGTDETAVVDFLIYRADLRISVIFLSSNISATQINQNTNPLKGTIANSNVVLKGKVYHVEEEIFFNYSIVNLYKISELLHLCHELINILQNNLNNVI